MSQKNLSVYFTSSLLLMFSKLFPNATMHKADRRVFIVIKVMSYRLFCLKKETLIKAAFNFNYTSIARSENLWAWPSGRSVASGSDVPSSIPRQAQFSRAVLTVVVDLIYVNNVIKQKIVRKWGRREHEFEWIYWLQVDKHCMTGFKDLECDLGELREHILPPTAIFPAVLVSDIVYQ